ncbi:MAG TPA: hypothetical protein VL326_21920 [Kofleriaceae bacterium]|nr:hypothetical protein [Kofleriaceae bacterium]
MINGTHGKDDVEAEVARLAQRQIEEQDAHRKARGVKKVPGQKVPTEQELMQKYYELYSKASLVADGSRSMSGGLFLLLATLVTIACGVGAVVGFFRAGLLGMAVGMFAPIVVVFVASRFARFRRRR